MPKAIHYIAGLVVNYVKNWNLQMSYSNYYSVIFIVAWAIYKCCKSLNVPVQCIHCDIY
jgi:hypothetical protein